MPLSEEDKEDLKSMLKIARKKALNFGLCLENDPADTVLLLHRRKAPEILMRRAQAQGDTAKLAMGQFRVEGKVVILDCASEAPANCARSLRLFLREVGASYQVKVNDPTGEQDSALKSNSDEALATMVAPFKKTRTIWVMTRTKMQNEIKRLETAIIDTCGNDPELKPVVAEAAELPSRLQVFDGELIKRLDDLIGTPDGSSLDALKAQARATVQEYETALNDPFFAELDKKNGFVNVAVTSSAKQALSAISKVLI